MESTNTKIEIGTRIVGLLATLPADVQTAFAAGYTLGNAQQDKPATQEKADGDQEANDGR